MTNVDGPEQEPAQPRPLTSEEEAALKFYGGAEFRLIRFLIGVSAISILIIVIVWGARAAVGFSVGVIVAGINFRWLHSTARKAVSAAVDDPGLGPQTRLLGASAAFGAVLRLALVTAVGYVIFKSSIQGFYGYVGGLFMPLCAVFAEALYEAWTAVRRGL